MGARRCPTSSVAPIDWNNLTLSNELEKRRPRTAGAIDPRIVGLIGAITQTHEITISALRSDHSMTTTEGYVSNHYYGRAMDIAVVDGVSCTDTAAGRPLRRTRHHPLPAAGPLHPTELIYCYDVDGPGPGLRLQRPLRPRPRRLRRLGCRSAESGTRPWRDSSRTAEPRLSC